MHAARRKFLRLGSGFLPMLLREGFHGYRVVGDPLPADAEVIGAAMSADLRSVLLVVESRTFPEVRPGECYPELAPAMRRGAADDGFEFTPSESEPRTAHS